MFRYVMFIEAANIGAHEMTHLHALYLRLSRERGYLAVAVSPRERELRSIWIAQIEKEIRCELAFLDKRDEPLPNMSDDELLAALEE